MAFKQIVDYFFFGCCWLGFAQLKFSGKVAENANVSNAVNPAWRTAKTHVRIFYIFMFFFIFQKSFPLLLVDCW